ncbi:YybS family protein [Dehalobacter sp. DCM]|uniref:DUF2232 domain-containing protein n=1 Tax=Dehalobacter sp. DCM TaxID=2907827 RepID=UPI0030816AEF|nr:YybS family protein [Dehalobacter sp. DCM]
MVISDKDAFRYVSRFVLVGVPILASFFSVWSWIIECIILLTFFVQTRNSGFRQTAILLGIGYVLSLIPVIPSVSIGVDSLVQIGFTPLAGLLLVLLKEKGLSTSHSIFWGLIMAMLLSAIPALPATIAALQPDMLDNAITGTLQLYKDQGLTQALAAQGMTEQQLETMLRMIIPMVFQLMPAFLAIVGMLEFGLIYIVFRFFIDKIKPKPMAYWKLPWYAVWLAIIGLSSYLGGDYLANTVLKIIGMNVMAVAAALSFVMGLVCLAYVIKKYRLSPWLVAILVIIALIMSPFILMTIVFIGLFDIAFNNRKVPEKTEGDKK